VIRTQPAVLLLLVLAGCSSFPPATTTSPTMTAVPPARTSETATPSKGPLDTTTWTPYKSKQYGFSLKHPPGWTVWPATRNWTPEDAGQMGKDGQEVFVTPADDLYVAVWSTPVTATPETLKDVASWVKRYCKQTGGSCSDLDRSVPLCNGTDCDPGLLVTDDDEFVQAFFTDGKHKGRMIVMEVGLPESHQNAAKYGGSRRLLEGFLSEMGVCPARPDQAPAGCP